MRSALRKCLPCSLYTLKDSCPKCDSPTVMPIPARYSPEDRFGEYRRAMRRME